MKFLTAVCLVALTFFVGCADTETASTTPAASNYDGSKFVLDAEPEGGLDIIAAREKIADGDEVVVVGRIGGSLNPWVKGRAAFYLVDPSLKACSDEKEDGEACSCTTPWDYCCETPKLPAAMAFVQFEEDGNIVKHDAKEIFGLEELETVVVKGKAERTEGNLIIHASSFFVRK
ncbi:MAG: hypothetical protein AB8B55_22245 [Mariniblastus sp.]